ncbi:DUF3311 domain-containing protein [Natronorubrum halophilum]|uniref:DUF3311 domain-containing protein n=1 Tax=Natronorubrum halophilum TaxID=1702106 RepID=UPI000EF6D886|nr:DUF3311 domain-containing protein [Natronorubrum halophilum]
MRRLERVGWITAAIVLSALAIPWMLWGDATVVAGLPLWLWWHIAWMGIASVVFWLFTRRAWGIGIETGSDAGDSSDAGGGPADRSSRSIGGGDQP